MSPDYPDGGIGLSEPEAPGSDSRDEPESDEQESAEQERSDRPDTSHAPDLTARFYVGLWLPAAGALLTYSIMRGNYWAAFVGVELLLVGWFALGKL